MYGELQHNFACMGRLVCQGHFLSSGLTEDILSPMIAQLRVYDSRKGDIPAHILYLYYVQYNSDMNDKVQQTYLSILKLHFV